jgi:hypothetical protein
MKWVSGLCRVDGLTITPINHPGTKKGSEVPTTPPLKAIEKGRFRPTYAGANMGHPDGVF